MNDKEQEIIIPLPNGGTLRCGEGSDCQWGGHLRICDPHGRELIRWVSTEWAEDPEVVIGAVFGAAIKPLEELDHLCEAIGPDGRRCERLGVPEVQDGLHVVRVCDECRADPEVTFGSAAVTQGEQTPLLLRDRILALVDQRHGVYWGELVEGLKDADVADIGLALNQLVNEGTLRMRDDDQEHDWEYVRSRPRKQDEHES